MAIKEYLPAETALRVQGSSKVHAQESCADEYQDGLLRFLEEAKTLAKFHHPNIIAVHDYLQANKTAYLVMVFEQGQTLGQLLKRQLGPGSALRAAGNPPGPGMPVTVPA